MEKITNRIEYLDVFRGLVMSLLVHGGVLMSLERKNNNDTEFR